MPKGGRTAGKAGVGAKKKVVKTFTPATTVAQADAYARQEFNIRLDQKAFGLNGANAINEALFNVKQEFGMSAFSLIHHIGKCAQGTASSIQGYYNPMTHGLALRHIKSTQCIQKWGATATRCKKTGFWSTDNPMQTIYHEVGHGVFHNLSGSKQRQIDAIMKSCTADIAKRQAQGQIAFKAQYVSKYAFTNSNEFFAECFAEYMAGKPRATAKKVIAIAKS